MHVGPAVTLVHLAPVVGPAVAWNCTAGQYAAAEPGASVIDSLARLGSVADATVPDDLTAGVAVTSTGQHTHVAVPGRPTRWTIAMWERTAANSASYAPFLHISGVPGGLLRTYDLIDDAATHDQLSGYGTSVQGADYGSEMWARAAPRTWHLITLSDSGTTTTLAVDGVSAGTVPSGPVPLTGIDVGDLGAGFRGSLADLSVFPTAAAPTALSTVDDVSCRMVK